MVYTVPCPQTLSLKCASHWSSNRWSALHMCSHYDPVLFLGTFQQNMPCGQQMSDAMPSYIYVCIPGLELIIIMYTNTKNCNTELGLHNNNYSLLLLKFIYG